MACGVNFLFFMFVCADVTMAMNLKLIRVVCVWDNLQYNAWDTVIVTFANAVFEFSLLS